MHASIPKALLFCATLAVLPFPCAANEYNALTTLWTAPGDDGLTGQVTAYELFYDTTPPGADLSAWWNTVPFSQRVTLIPPLAAAGQTDSTLVTGLTQGTTYYFVIVARDEAANASGFSNVATGTTKSCGAPTAMPGSFGADPDTASGIQVNWDAATDPAALSLHLYRSSASGSTWSLVQSLPPSSTTYHDTQVAAGGTYRYRATWAGPDIQGVTCEGPYSAQAIATSPGNSGLSVPKGSGSAHVYPNPAGDLLQVALDVTASGALPVKLRVFDMSGHWLGTVAEGTFPPGRSVVTWNRLGRTGTRLAPGYYEILGTIGETRVRERLVLLP